MFLIQKPESYTFNTTLEQKKKNPKILTIYFYNWYDPEVVNCRNTQKILEMHIRSHITISLRSADTATHHSTKTGVFPVVKLLPIELILTCSRLANSLLAWTITATC